MIRIYPSDSRAPEQADGSAARTGSALWIDLIDPREDERRQADQLLGSPLPTREQTSAIELSSRLSSAEDALRVNIPSFVRTEGEHGPSNPSY